MYVNGRTRRQYGISNNENQSRQLEINNNNMKYHQISVNVKRDGRRSDGI